MRRYLMEFDNRKIKLWLYSLLGVIAAYVLYTSLIEVPDIEPPVVMDDVSGAFFEDVNGTVGQFGEGVEIGTVKKARFISDKQEFGFERLLHDSGHEWELEKPYMKFFGDNFTCHLNGDRGNVQVEMVGGRPNPKDAELLGNVVIYIEPTEGSEIEESFIYLDNMIFVSEKSQISTDGPVKFISKSARADAVGFELVYNDENNKVELFKLITLKSLEFKGDSAAITFSGRQEKVTRSSTTGSSSSPKIGSADLREVEDEPVFVSASEDEEEYYKCIFGGNVVMETDEEVVFADEVIIDKILWQGTGSTASKPEDSKAGSASGDESLETIVAGDGETPWPKADLHAEWANPQEKDITRLWCDGGVVVAPSDEVISAMEFYRAKPSAESSRGKPEKDEVLAAAEKKCFSAKKITHYRADEETVAGGPLELVFYTDKVGEKKKLKKPVPVTITAKENVSFDSKINQAVFAGEVHGWFAYRDNDKNRRENDIWSDKLVVNVDGNEIEHITASGEKVYLVGTKKKRKSEEILNGVELSCQQLDFDSADQLIYAAGPNGQIQINNTHTKHRKTKRLSLKGPCYALIDYFDTLVWKLDEGKVEAEGVTQGLLISHVPVKSGEAIADKVIRIGAGKVDVEFKELSDDRYEIVELIGTGGITYEEKGKNFAGDNLLYEQKKTRVIIKGSEGNPCFVNGARADNIRLNTKSGNWKTNVAGPGAVQGSSRRNWWRK